MAIHIILQPEPQPLLLACLLASCHSCSCIQILGRLFQLWTTLDRIQQNSAEKEQVVEAEVQKLSVKGVLVCFFPKAKDINCTADHCAGEGAWNPGEN